MLSTSNYVKSIGCDLQGVISQLINYLNDPYVYLIYVQTYWRFLRLLDIYENFSEFEDNLFAGERCNFNILIVHNEFG